MGSIGPRGEVACERAGRRTNPPSGPYGSVAAGLLHIKDRKQLLRRPRQIRRRLEGCVDNATDMDIAGLGFLPQKVRAVV